MLMVFINVQVLLMRSNCMEVFCGTCEIKLEKYPDCGSKIQFSTNNDNSKKTVTINDASTKYTLSEANTTFTNARLGSFENCKNATVSFYYQDTDGKSILCRFENCGASSFDDPTTFC